MEEESMETLIETSADTLGEDGGEEKENETLMESEYQDATAATDTTANLTLEESITSDTPVKRKRGRPPLSANKGNPTPKKTRQVSVSAATDGELYTSIVEGRSALQTVVSEWVERYQGDQEAGLLEIIQFFVRCCGCQAEISLSNFRHQEATDIIRTITENFDEDGFDYPLILSGPLYKKFKSNYCEFVERLVIETGDIIYDEYMLDTLVKWLIGLSDSEVRAFRHTSTLACLKLVTGLVHLVVSLASEIDNTQRQLETEKRKSGGRQAIGKLKKLEEALALSQSQLSEIHDIMNNLFTSVFIRRYRDTRPEVRAICIAEIGVWMLRCSSRFLSDNYLKYVGWTLSDKSGEVRLQALQALLALYSVPDLVPHLELFTTKFKDRIVSMKTDKDDTIASTAISLCTLLFSLDMLDADDCVELCQLVHLENRVLGRAAGKFAVRYIFCDEIVTKTRGRPSKNQKRPTNAQIKLKELVNFYIESDIHKHAEYMVDSVWGHTDLLKDWKNMIEVLTSSSCPIELSQKEEVVAIELMARAAERACGSFTVLKGVGNKMLNAKEKRAMETDKHTMATALIPVLPQLLVKYGTNPECAINLCCIVKQFDLEVYVEIRGQKLLEDLLSELKSLVLQHTSQEVLNEISTCYCHLLDPDFTLHSVVDLSFNQLVDELVSIFDRYMENIDDIPLNDDDNDDVYNFGTTLQRLLALFKQIDITKKLSFDKFHKLVEFGVDESATDILVIPSMNCDSLFLLWFLKEAESHSPPDRDTIRSIRTSMEKVITICSDLLKLGSPAVQQESFVILCDLLMLFAKQLACKEELISLVYVPSSSLQTSLCDYVTERVFNEGDLEDDPTTDEEAFAQAARLNERRLLLAGYLKLVVYSVVEARSSVAVLGQYIKFYYDYGDLLRHAFTKLREADSKSTVWYKTVLQVLQEQYTSLQLDNTTNGIDYCSTEWANLKDLAHRIALTTGFDLVKIRHSIVHIHFEGIKFALQTREEEEEKEDEGVSVPENLSFLEVLAGFSFRLLDADKQGTNGVRGFLESRLEDNYSMGLHEVVGSAKWESLSHYVTSLKPGGEDAQEQAAGVPKKRGRPPKRKILEDGPTALKSLKPNEE
ncbi:PREDICTED: cohesin subunit SA-1 [Amphimedon queenslandica]|uniref:SCD domain-containing protein n=1 Tax=Amphimedon queenslandica TaxID=400682 RepID=A0A1X7VR05_AMPQE|nr:PREDICTED: cohesin subunit SA-1 [Amphimedon queenslandica]|eukprot:XP_011408151.1 PREDICTED: cohesin subunit SA-1 [Amphimedon queenslandica]